MSDLREAQFSVGQIVQHKLFGYRGLIFDVDPEFSNDEDWYERMARTRPPKDKPWYHVLVDGAEHVTYVAERNLEEAENTSEPIEHPLVAELFSKGDEQGYTPRGTVN